MATLEQLNRFIIDISEIRKPALILLQETKASKEEMDNVVISGYRVINTTIPNAKQQWGSMILIAENYNAEPLNTKQEQKENVEIIGVRISGNTKTTWKQPIQIWNLYSPPHKEASLVSLQIIKKLIAQARQEEISIIGDFNCNIKVDSRTKATEMRNWMMEVQRKELVFIANDYNSTTIRDTTIDLALTTNERMVASPAIVNLNSDHYPLIVAFKQEAPKRTRKDTRPKYRRDEAIAEQVKIKCKELAEEADEKKVDELARDILYIWKATAQDKQKTKKKEYPEKKIWWNKEIETLYQKKQEITRKLATEPYDTKKVLLEEIKSIDLELQTEITKAKNVSFQKYASQLNHKKNSNIYKFARNVSKPSAPKITSVIITDKEGVNITSTKEKAKVLAARYKNPLGEEIRLSDNRWVEIKREIQDNKEKLKKKTDNKVSMNEVRIAREQMYDGKAPGDSGICKEDFEIAGQDIDRLVQILANKMIEEQRWPSTLKKQVIIPLSKHHNKVNQIKDEETRPISLLESLDKWIEKIIYNRIRRHVKFNSSQIGYKDSCDLHTTLLSEHISKNKKKFNIIAFTDISKAFDSVPLKELEFAIINSTIPDEYKQLLIDFTRNRQYRVAIREDSNQEESSNWNDLKCGTPQGSVLGPLLWNLFIDPLLDLLQEQQVEVESLDLAFADDLTPVATSDNRDTAAEAIQSKIEIIDKYLRERGMKMSIKKLKVMCITKNKRKQKRKLEIKLNGEPIQIVKENRLLGITYDESFKFKKHTEETKTRMAKRMKLMRMLKGVEWGPTQATMIVLHNSYIASVPRSGMMAWYPFVKKRESRSIDALLNESIRIATGLPALTLTEALRIEAGTDSIDQLASKAAASLYLQINPHHPEVDLLCKDYYIKQKPTWAKKFLHSKINMAWEEPIQPTNNKTYITTDNLKFYKGTLLSQTEVEEVEEQYDYILYTDASVDQHLDSGVEGHAAIGYAWYHRTGKERNCIKESAARLGCRHTSFSAEAIAIIEALKDKPDQIQDQDKIGVFTDSLSNIKHLNSGVIIPTEQAELANRLSIQKNEISFHHTKSHVNIKRNEHVDKLCSTSATNVISRKIPRNGEFTKAQVKERMAKKTVVERRDSLWDIVLKDENEKRAQKSTAEYVNDLLGECNEPPKEHKDLPRKESILLSKARMNRWTSCKRYLKRINQIKDDLCTFCIDKTDTTKHQLDRCPEHEYERNQLKRKLGGKYANITEMLMTKNAQDLKLLTDYLITIDEKALERLKKQKGVKLKIIH